MTMRTTIILQALLLYKVTTSIVPALAEDNTTLFPSTSPSDQELFCVDRLWASYGSLESFETEAESFDVTLCEDFLSEPICDAFGWSDWAVYNDIESDRVEDLVFPNNACCACGGKSSLI